MSTEYKKEEEGQRYSNKTHSIHQSDITGTTFFCLAVAGSARILAISVQR